VTEIPDALGGMERRRSSLAIKSESRGVGWERLRENNERDKTLTAPVQKTPFRSKISK